MEIKIKEVQASYKGSKDYNSIEVSFTAEVSGTDHKVVAKQLFDDAKAIVEEKLRINGNNNPKQTDIAPPSGDEEEIGAAWPDKRFKDKLSCKDSKTGAWRSVKIDDLEKIDDNTFKLDGVLFRKIPEEERKSPKAPTYRMFRGKE